MNKAIIFLILILCHYHCYSQKQGRDALDSLLGILPVLKTDTDKIKTWISLSKNYQVMDPDSGLFFGNLALKKSQNINFQIGEVNALICIGGNYTKINSFDMAINHYNEAINKCLDIHDSDVLAIAYSGIGVTYSYLRDNEKALKYAQNAMRINENRNNIFQLSANYNLNGILNFQMGKNDEALKFYDKALVAAKIVNNKRIISYAYSNSGIVYQKLNQFPKALEYLFKALEIEEELGDIYGIATEYGSISAVYLGIYNEQKNKGNPRSSTYLDSTIYYANKGIEYCMKCGDLIDKINIIFSLSEAYRLKNDYKKALDVFTEGSKLKDSLFSEETQKKIREAESKQQSTINEKEIQLLQAQKKLERNYYMIGGISLLLLSIGIFSRLQVIRKTKRKLEEKNEIITKEKKRSDDLLLNILPSEVAEELKAKGTADARQFDVVTVMFTDFKNFTKITEMLSPSELVAEIHTCFKAFDNIITKYNIEKIKTIGDSYMCAGGLPLVNTTNATDVVKAALEIQQFMKAHLQQRKNDGKEVFEIRIGIHTGPVVAGIVGVKKFAYDIWGDTVNIASRMESSGESGKVNISGSTYELVKDSISCVYRGKIEAKNKGEIDMYFVEG